MTSPNFRRVRLALAAFMCAAGAASSAAASTVIYDSIVGNSFSGYALAGGYFAPFDKSYLTALRFTATVSGTIDTLTMAANGQPSFTVDLYSDAGGRLGQSLQTMLKSGSTAPLSYASGSFAGGAALVAGTDYWIVLGNDHDFESWGYMQGSTAPGAGAMAFGETVGFDVPTVLSYSSPDIALGLRISVAGDGPVPGVPEPATWALLGAGVLLLAARRRSVR
jgi:hypothetical protein